MNHIQNSSLKLDFFQFGPIICHYKLEEQFVDDLTYKGKKSNIDFKENLAGHIQDEKLFSEKDTKWFLNKTQDIFLSYIDTLHKRYSINKIPKSLEIQKLWINFMKDGEYNPPHHHKGDISFVIYTEVPNEIIEENNSFKGVGTGPGCIEFLYGEVCDAYRSNFSFVPQKGNMFIFPAKLRHYVAPFKSKVIRTSISGNLFI